MAFMTVNTESQVGMRHKQKTQAAGVQVLFMCWYYYILQPWRRVRPERVLRRGWEWGPCVRAYKLWTGKKKDAVVMPCG